MTASVPPADRIAVGQLMLVGHAQLRTHEVEAPGPEQLAEIAIPSWALEHYEDADEDPSSSETSDDCAGLQLAYVVPLHFLASLTFMVGEL